MDDLTVRLARSVRRVLAYRSGGRHHNEVWLPFGNYSMVWDTYRFNVPCRVLEDLEMLLEEIGYGKGDEVRGEG